MLTKNIYEILALIQYGDRTPIQNVYEILGTGSGRYITCYIYPGPNFSCESNGVSILGSFYLICNFSTLMCYICSGPIF